MSAVTLIDSGMFRHVLNFWDSRGLLDANVFTLLQLTADQSLPDRLNAAPVADAHYYIHRRANQPLFEFELGQYIGTRDIDLWQLLISSASLNEGVAAIMPYIYLTSAAIKVDLHVTPSSTIATVEGIDDIQFNRPECCFSEQALATAVTLLYQYIKNSDRAQYASTDLTMMVPEKFSDNIEGLKELFGIQVLVADRYGLEIHRDAWFAKSNLASSERYNYLIRQMRKADKQYRRHMALFLELKEALTNCLEERHFSQELVAERLGINVRNLQRRLKSLGTNYQALLDEVRHDYAVKLVTESDLALTQIAYNIGYAEPSAFYKAFKRWTGCTPGDYRYLHSVDGLEESVSRIEELLSEST